MLHFGVYVAVPRGTNTDLDEMTSGLLIGDLGLRGPARRVEKVTQHVFVNGGAGFRCEAAAVQVTSRFCHKFSDQNFWLQQVTEKRRPSFTMIPVDMPVLWPRSMGAGG